jgi:hypothetical protein
MPSRSSSALSATAQFNHHGDLGDPAAAFPTQYPPGCPTQGGGVSSGDLVVARELITRRRRGTSASALRAAESAQFFTDSWNNHKGDPVPPRTDGCCADDEPRGGNARCLSVSDERSGGGGGNNNDHVRFGRGGPPGGDKETTLARRAPAHVLLHGHRLPDPFSAGDLRGENGRRGKGGGGGAFFTAGHSEDTCGPSVGTDQQWEQLVAGRGNRAFALTRRENVFMASGGEGLPVERHGEDEDTVSSTCI